MTLLLLLHPAQAGGTVTPPTTSAFVAAPVGYIGNAVYPSGASLNSDVGYTADTAVVIGWTATGF